MMVRLRWSRATALCAGLLVLASVSLAQQRTVVHSKAILRADGSRIEKGQILIEAGRIVAIGADLEVPADTRVVDRSDKILAPGLVDLDSRAGAPTDLYEETDSVDLESDARDAFVPLHRDWDLLVAAGVTSVCLVPEGRSVIAGVGCVVKTAGPNRETAFPGPVALALTRDVINRNRPPTSFAGSQSLLRAAFSDPQPGILAELSAKTRPALFRVDSPAALNAGVRLLQGAGLEAAFVCESDVARQARESLTKDSLVVLEPIDPSSPLRERLLPAELVASGLKVAFHCSSPRRHPETLRCAAVLAAANGLPRSQAIQSITSTPAQALKAAGRLGDLDVGCDADFIVLDGDLLDLSAPILETWIGGRRVYRRADG
ncbi:MAG: amidohydrolase family protein [Planctomycetes bacterium]|nr:amidohydrolase family protein [Planctomycetota bacterium]